MGAIVAMVAITAVALTFFGILFYSRPPPPEFRDIEIGSGFEDDQIFADDRIGLVNSAHDHADMIVYVNGERIDFSQEQFQVRSTYVHFERGDGDVVHTHANNVNLGFNFQALGMRITSTSISTQDGQLYENGAVGELRVFVNGVRIEEPPNYIIQALDKILISYGDENEAELHALLETVPDRARNFQGVFDNPP